MTFDARKGGSRNDGNNIVFGAGVLAIVGGAFLAVLAFPSQNTAVTANLADTHTFSAPMTVSSPSPADTHLNQVDGARSFIDAMMKIDARAANALRIEFQQLPSPSVDRQKAFLVARGFDILKHHVEDLTVISTDDIDGLLDDARNRLRNASQSGNDLCDGGNYQRLTPGALVDLGQLKDSLPYASGALRDYQLSVIAHLFEAMARARLSPEARGQVTATDIAAWDGIAMSLVSDPQLRPLLMQSSPDEDGSHPLAGFDMCAYGATAMLAIKTLPQDSKGRLFADLVDGFELGGGQVADFSGL